MELPTVLKNGLVLRLHGVHCGKDVKAKGKLRIVKRGPSENGSHSILNGHAKFDPIGFGGESSLVTEANGHIHIGEHFGMSSSAIYSRIGITIGDYVMLGAGVKIYDTDFHALSPQMRGGGASTRCIQSINRSVLAIMSLSVAEALC